MRKSSLRVGSCALSVLLLAAAPALAGDEGGEEGFLRDYLSDLERVGQRLVSLAEAVPAEKYSWRPSEEVRTVSEVYMHVVGVNLLVPAGLGASPAAGMEAGEPFTLMRQLEADVTEKDRVIAKLQESIAYAKEAVREVAAQDLEATSELFGFPASKRAYLLVLLTHAHEHLGQSIAYARSIGVVPPWSRQGGGGENGS